MIHVAVVMSKKVAVDLRSARTMGDWSCFVSRTEAEAVDAALEAVRRWEASDATGKRRYGPYEVVVGTLASKVFVPTAYTLQPIKETAPKRKYTKRRKAGRVGGSK